MRSVVIAVLLLMTPACGGTEPSAVLDGAAGATAGTVAVSHGGATGTAGSASGGTYAGGSGGAPGGEAGSVSAAGTASGGGAAGTSAGGTAGTAAGGTGGVAAQSCAGIADYNWDGNRTFQPGDLVVSNGSLWVATVESHHLGVCQPGGYWKLVKDVLTFLPTAPICVHEFALAGPC